MTIGDFMKLIEAVNTREEAAALVEAETKRICELEERTDVDNVRSILLANIGYLSGYYSPQRAAEILELFDTSHPIFGRTTPTPEEAFEAGRKLAAPTPVVQEGRSK